MITNKYNIGDKVYTSIPYYNCPRNKVEAIIDEIKLDKQKYKIKYRISINCSDEDEDGETGCTGCAGYVCEENIIRLLESQSEEEHKRSETPNVIRFPCAVGDFVLFSNGDILPVIYLTKTKDDIVVGCQNGITVSASLDCKNWHGCKGFYKTRQQAKAAFEEVQSSND